MILYLYKNNMYKRPCCFKNGFISAELNQENLTHYVKDNIDCEYCGEKHVVKEFTTFTEFNTARIHAEIRTINSLREVANGNSRKGEKTNTFKLNLESDGQVSLDPNKTIADIVEES